MVNKWVFLTVVGILMLIGIGIIAGFFYTVSDFSFTSSFGSKIARIQLVGEITSFPDQVTQTLSAQDVVSLLKDAEEDFSVSAVLLEINSPGGSVVATKQIVEQIRLMEKPVVSWIADAGTSGAYYVAAATTYSIADEDSLTGSIGVISVIPDLSEFLADYNVKVNILKQGKNKAMGSPFKELTQSERAILDDAMLQIFENFKNKIKEFRGDKLDLAQFDEIADGRILTGRRAFELGLIDNVGGKQSAIDKAAEIAGIENPIVEDFYYYTPSFPGLFGAAGYNFARGFNQGLQSSFSNNVQSYLK